MSWLKKKFSQPTASAAAEAPTPKTPEPSLFASMDVKTTPSSSATAPPPPQPSMYDTPPATTTAAAAATSSSSGFSFIASATATEESAADDLSPTDTSGEAPTEASAFSFLTASAGDGNADEAVVEPTPSSFGFLSTPIASASADPETASPPRESSTNGTAPSYAPVSVLAASSGKKKKMKSKKLVRPGYVAREETDSPSTTVDDLADLDVSQQQQQQQQHQQQQLQQGDESVAVRPDDSLSASELRRLYSGGTVEQPKQEDVLPVVVQDEALVEPTVELQSERQVEAEAEPVVASAAEEPAVTTTTATDREEEEERVEEHVEHNAAVVEEEMETESVVISEAVESETQVQEVTSEAAGASYTIELSGSERTLLQIQSAEAQLVGHTEAARELDARQTAVFEARVERHVRLMRLREELVRLGEQQEEAATREDYDLAEELGGRIDQLTVELGEAGAQGQDGTLLETLGEVFQERAKHVDAEVTGRQRFDRELRDIEEEQARVLREAKRRDETEFANQRHKMTGRRDRVNKALSHVRLDLDHIAADEEKVQRALEERTVDERKEKSRVEALRQAVCSEIAELEARLLVLRRTAEEYAEAIAEEDAKINEVRTTLGEDIERLGAERERSLAEQAKHEAELELVKRDEELLARSLESAERERQAQVSVLSTVEQRRRESQAAVRALEYQQSDMDAFLASATAREQARRLAVAPLGPLKERAAGERERFKTLTTKVIDGRAALASARKREQDLGERIPELEREKQLAVSAKAFKEAKRLATELKTVRDEVEALKTANSEAEKTLATDEEELSGVRTSLNATTEELASVEVQVDVDFFSSFFFFFVIHRSNMSMRVAETAKAVLAKFLHRGWGGVVVCGTQGSIPDLIKTKRGDLLKCADGRESELSSKQAGPKLLGGVYGIAAMTQRTSIGDIDAICDEVKQLGYHPSVHGDTNRDVMGCGFFRLWSRNHFRAIMGRDYVKKPGYTGQSGREKILELGADYDVHFGNQHESEVVINMIPDTTLKPVACDQRFVADVWVIQQLNEQYRKTSAMEIDLEHFADVAIDTVEALSKTCRSARILIPCDPKSDCTRNLSCHENTCLSNPPCGETPCRSFQCCSSIKS